MKTVLRANAEIDLLSPEEHARHLAKAFRQFEAWTRAEEGETLVHAALPFTTDATGGTSTLPDGGAGVYRVPAGFDAFVTRLTVDFEGSTAATPVTCDVRICADANTPAGLRTLNNQVPSVFANSKSHAPMFRGGQRVIVSLTGGPVTTKMYCTVQVLLTQRKALETDTLDSEGA